MNTESAVRHEWVGRGVFLAGLVLTLELHLLPALLAGLLVHGLVSVLVPVLRVPSLGRDGTRALAVALTAAAVIGAVIAVVFLILGVVRDNTESVAALVGRMAEILEASREKVPPFLLPYLPTDAEQLRLDAIDWLRANASAFSGAGKGLGRGLTHIVIGMVIGALVVLDSAVPRDASGPLALALRGRARGLSRAFRNVVFAQVRISAVNTALTAAFLIIVLPAAGVHLPFTKTLVAVTFVAGLVPILGNLISNTVIFVVSLSQSLTVALGALAYLVVIHKLEYFLNARIIGGHIHARAWELLVAMLVMEAVFGLAGVIAAPIFYAYLKDELRETKLV